MAQIRWTGRVDLRSQELICFIENSQIEHSRLDGTVSFVLIRKNRVLHITAVIGIVITWRKTEQLWTAQHFQLAKDSLTVTVRILYGFVRNLKWV